MLIGHYWLCAQIVPTTGFKVFLHSKLFRWRLVKQQPFRLNMRGSTCYYKLPWETCYHSTGLIWQRKAENFAFEKYKVGKEIRANATTKSYVEDFFIWKKCRWIQSAHQNGRSLSKDSATW